MSLAKKYGVSSLLISCLLLSASPSFSEVAPNPDEIIDIAPSVSDTPYSSSTPDADLQELEKLQNEKPEIQKTPQPTKPKVSPTPMPSKSAPAPKPKKEVKKVVKPEPKKVIIKEQKKSDPIVIKKNKENSKYILRPSEITLSTYTAQKGDNLQTLAKRWNMRYRTLLALNNAKNPYLFIGQKVIADKSIQVKSDFDGIVVNIPERRLYHFDSGKLLRTYPVTVGLPSKEWQTPPGSYKVLYKVKDPIWKVPVSIQKEMAARGQKVLKEVPAGPNNPLGKWWMGLTWTGLGIHSTNAPLSVGYSVSHGCVRMTPTNAAELWSKTATNTPVRLIYQPVKLSVDENNKVYVQVFRDVYGKTPDMTKYARQMISDFSLDPHVDWTKVTYAVKTKKGVFTPIGKSL
ncbi:LysM peptidoglycan-binding domain-containing protein [bacterium]|nr:MAG: LysM peptidoglycan-binding domain-containing protein [bacterium]